MFLKTVMRLNKDLVAAAQDLIQRGEVPAEACLLDLDRLVYNGQALFQAAQREGMTLFYDFKALGENVQLARRLAQTTGLTKASVSAPVAFRLMDQGLAIGNVTEVDRISPADLKALMAYGSDYLTLTRLEDLQLVLDLSEDLGKHQDIFIQISEVGDTIPKDQPRGFAISQIKGILELLDTSAYVEIRGIVTHPCFSFDAEADIQSTSNKLTVARTRERLFQLGYTDLLFNLSCPSCVSTLPLIKTFGGSLALVQEALLGMGPLHEVSDQPEKPALLPLSESAPASQLALISGLSQGKIQLEGLYETKVHLF